jgi:glycosyltransferase involved in cell wall biosynthesis
MAERKKIALLFVYNENWIGGTYYIMNLILALKKLSTYEQPHITLVYQNEIDKNKIAELNYPFIDFKPIAFRYVGLAKMKIVRFLIFKIFKKIFGVHAPADITKENSFELIFPYETNFDKKISKKNVFWIPDFQEVYYPEFFSEFELNERRKKYLRIINLPKGEIVFSSYDAFNDFKNLFPACNLKTHVVQFAVDTSVYATSCEFNNIKIKYELPDKYFFCPNQFWVHKNHEVLVKALALIKNNKNIVIVLTGKNYDFRVEGKSQYDKFQDLVKELGLTANFKYLGFINREVQLCIMKNSCAIIQPSLFEGWSTVVEDAKSLNVPIIASDINVHKEQLNSEATYFSPTNPSELASILEVYKPKQVNFDYTLNQINFAKNFIKLLND